MRWLVRASNTVCVCVFTQQAVWSDSDQSRYIQGRIMSHEVMRLDTWVECELNLGQDWAEREKEVVILCL